MNLESTIWFVGGAIMPSMLVAWLATFAARRLAPRWGLIDRPNERKVHLTPTPMGGGIGIAIGVLIPFLVGQVILIVAINSPAIGDLLPEFARPHLTGLLDRSAGLWVLLGGATILMVVGLIDDRRGLDWRVRISIQFAVAAFCVVTQGWRLTAFIDLPRLSWIISMGLSTIWIVALINSFNMLDNMDGLSAGVAGISSALLATVMLISPDPITKQPQLFVAGFLLVLVGSLLGFLWHNRPPARIFMGDAGSYFIGFCIAVATLLATYTGYESKAPLAILAPLCVMAVPLYDMITVIWIRVRSGESPFHADKNHFSHRLVELGLTKTQAVLTVYLMTTTCGLGAVLLHRLDLMGAIVVISMISCVLLLIAILETSARRKLNE
ncbi:MAG: MraY family glycosyltransferase [Pirellulaceae bacterium]|jgi:UDP-GlcNAc:undecaprenyl-phosphate GlcNAc-1-phosphate transferase|nr:MraY family glycosyltransferase [Pirellulaceae bacterium]MDP6722060.1 MraY family glycosyltransferase [Pirellulaceae bacterium]